MLSLAVRELDAVIRLKTAGMDLPLGRLVDANVRVLDRHNEKLAIPE